MKEKSSDCMIDMLRYRRKKEDRRKFPPVFLFIMVPYKLFG